ncbi:MAG: hypothetical protein NZP34_10070 [Caldilineales bacterium]|nr:hypothetical protein [Caldilineales bacterium]MCX7854159.1 hypothetical protein [Caldilineales bacterium]
MPPFPPSGKPCSPSGSPGSSGGRIDHFGQSRQADAAQVAAGTLRAAQTPHGMPRAAHEEGQCHGSALRGCVTGCQSSQHRARGALSTACA